MVLGGRPGRDGECGATPSRLQLSRPRGGYCRVALVDCLRLLEAVVNVGEEFIPVWHAFGHRCHTRLTGLIGANGGGSRP